jgi:8-oxo-dGTP pyrophosphatase MutT (NUDIX family)
MYLFINDHPIRLVNPKQLHQLHDLPDYDVSIDCRLVILRPEKLRGHCLLLNVDTSTVDRLWDFLESVQVFDFQSITIIPKDLKEAEEHIKSHYKIVKAAGGVVCRDESYLFILRNKKWDLPKGKLEGDERSKIGALREVEEECGIEVGLDEKICTTWHTYTQNGNAILKRTKWYRMHVLDDSQAQPQLEEGIEEIRWLTATEAHKALANSYSSIRFVFDQLLHP